MQRVEDSVPFIPVDGKVGYMDNIEFHPYIDELLMSTVSLDQG